MRLTAFTSLILVWLCSIVCPAAAAGETVLVVGHKIADSVGFYSEDGKLLATVPVGKHPHEMALAPDGRYAYVTDNGILWMTDPGEGGNTISIIDLDRRARIGVIDLGPYRRPHGIAVDPRTGRLAVTTENPDALILVDPVARKVLRRFDTQGADPHMVTLGPRAEWAFASNTASATIAAIHLETGALKLIPTDARPQGGVLSLDGKFLYVTNSEGNTISIIDTARQERIGTIATGKGPGRIAITPDGRELVYNLQAGEGVGIADIASRKQVAEIRLPGPPLSLHLSADGRRAYAGIQSLDLVAVVSVPERRLLRSFSTPKGAGPDAVLEIRAAAATPAQARLEEVERTRWFREAKFGIFIHWGPYAVIGRHEWARHMLQIPQAEYDNYARRFNPVRYDPNAWVALFEKAGARYIVITSKHHDGFSIWRSKVSDYDMEITPYPGDPLKELAEAARRRAMRLGFYHSIMDWHHPDYRPRRAWEAADPKAGGNNLRYIEFMKAQLGELLTEFGEVAVVWFDGEWEDTLKDLGKEDEIYEFVRNLQPNTLINDRLYQRRPGNRADFGTPEQYVPDTGLTDPSGKPILWEACVTINNDSWGYNKYETEFKTERDLIRMLIEVVSKGGNLLLNVGPMPDGRIQPEFVSRLEAIGAWMKVNGEAIYATSASPFARLPFFGRATVKGNRLYLHVFQWPTDRLLRVPGLKNLVHSARLLADPGISLPTRRDGDDVLISLPEEPPDEIASVVMLELDGAPVVTPYAIRPGADGVVTLGAESCEIRTDFGQRAKKENALGRVFLTQWSRAADVPVWTFALPKGGRYRVEIRYGAGRASAGTEFTIVTASGKLAGKVEPTGHDWVFKNFTVGELELGPGEHRLEVQAQPRGVPAMQLERVVLRPVASR
jgi:alpha-L-fucosidase